MTQISDLQARIASYKEQGEQRREDMKQRYPDHYALWSMFSDVFGRCPYVEIDGKGLGKRTVPRVPAETVVTVSVFNKMLEAGMLPVTQERPRRRVL